MQTSPSRYVVDSSVLIDLHNGSILAEFFRLPMEISAPDLLVEEELVDPDRQTLTQLGLEVLTLSDREVEEITQLAAQYRRVSTLDLAALVLARSLGAVLLTGDKHLRKAAEQEGVQVHGTLWVLRELIDRGLLVALRAAEALQQMLNQGSRLPPEECQELLKHWGWSSLDPQKP